MFARLRRERHCFAVLAVLLFSLQWVVPVAAATSGSVDICYGNGEPESGTNIHLGHCPGAVGCASLSGAGLLVPGTVSYDEPGPVVSGLLEHPHGQSFGSAGLNPFDAFGRGPPCHS